MKTSKYLRIAGIAVVILGCIHLAATPVIFSSADFHKESVLASLYMFVMVGISTIFVGWLQHFVMSRWDLDTGYRIIFRITVAFLIIMGIGAVIAMWDNPFAYICLLIGIVELLLTRHMILKSGMNTL